MVRNLSNEEVCQMTLEDAGIDPMFGEEAVVDDREEAASNSVST